MTEPLRIEEVLATEGVYLCTTVGVSMEPLLKNRRDTVEIRPPRGRLQKYDVALYRRGPSYVLHRVVRVLPDSYVICGDHCVTREYDIRDEQIVGVMTAFWRKGHYIKADNRLYRLWAVVHCALFWLRAPLLQLRYRIGRLLCRRGDT